MRKIINLLKRIKHKLDLYNPKISYNLMTLYYQLKNSKIDKTYADDLIQREARLIQSDEKKNSFEKVCRKKTHLYINSTKSTELRRLLKNVELNCVQSEKFFYSIDVFKSWHCR